MWNEPNLRLINSEKKGSRPPCRFFHDYNPRGFFLWSQFLKSLIGLTPPSQNRSLLFSRADKAASSRDSDSAKCPVTTLRREQARRSKDQMSSVYTCQPFDPAPSSYSADDVLAVHRGRSLRKGWQSLSSSCVRVHPKGKGWEGAVIFRNTKRAFKFRHAVIEIGKTLKKKWIQYKFLNLFQPISILL